jgi:hypothetical protein
MKKAPQAFEAPFFHKHDKKSNTLEPLTCFIVQLLN